MLARLQQFWVVVLLLLAALAFTLAVRADWPVWAAVLAVLTVINVHAVVLAIEFSWLRQIEPGPGLAKPSGKMIIAAWWGEVLTGLNVFGWRQPFRSLALPDKLTGAAGQRGVLMVHGFVCNRGLWNPWMTRLRESRTPYIAVNLEPVFGSIDAYVQTLEDAICRLEAATGRAPIVVAHSMGGLAVRAWLRDHDGDARVHSVVTIGTPHLGTWMARFAVTDNGRQMRQDNEWLAALAASESPARRGLFTCYFGHCDNIVFPAANGMLPGAANRHVPGIAHVHLAFHEPIFEDVLGRAAT
jgi:pimeloyl-ACP methyl ester carboxylesterase